MLKMQKKSKMKTIGKRVKVSTIFGSDITGQNGFLDLYDDEEGNE